MFTIRKILPLSHSNYLSCISLVILHLLASNDQVKAQALQPEFTYPHLHYKYKSNAEKNQEIQTLIQEGTNRMDKEPDSALVLFQQALIIGRELKAFRINSNIFTFMAKIYEQRLQYPEAIYLQQRAIQARINAGDNSPFDLYAQLSLLYFQSGNYKEPTTISRKMNLQFDSIHTFYPAAVDIFGARSFIHLGQMDSAAILLHRALKKWPKTNAENAYFLCMAYAGLAQVADNLKSSTKALEYLDKALAVAREYQDSLAIVNLNASKVTIYNSMGDYQGAARIARENILYARKINNAEVHSLSTYNLAGILIKLGHYEEGLKYAQECFKAAQQIQTFWLRINANYIMGYAYTKLKDYPNAIQYLEPAITLAEEKNYINNIADAYGIIASAYAGTGEFQKAYEYRTRFGQLRDSLRGQENAARIAHVEARYETAVQKQSLAEQKVLLEKKESKLREKNFWIGGITGGAALLGVLLLTLYRSRSRQQQAGLLQIKKEQELDLIKARMETEQEERTRIGQELHDGVVSQLLSIKLSLNALEEEHFNVRQPTLRQIANQLDEATLELRTTAHNLMPEALLRAGLEKAIHSLCEQIQRFSRMDVSFQVYGAIPEIQHEKKLSLYRIIQELIQNVIKHADATQLLVQLSCRDALLALTVEDNGIGLAADSTRKQGTGLANVRRRVEALRGSLDIHSEPGVETTFYMEFDLQHLR